MTKYTKKRDGPKGPLEAGRGRKSVQIRKSAREKSKGIACSGPAVVDLQLTSGDATVCDASMAVRSGRR